MVYGGDSTLTFAPAPPVQCGRCCVVASSSHLAGASGLPQGAANLLAAGCRYVLLDTLMLAGLVSCRLLYTTTDALLEEPLDGLVRTLRR